MAENLPSEKLAIVATIDPANYSSGTNLSDAIDMQYHDNVMFILLGGKFDNGKDGTIDLKIKESDASGGTYHKITGNPSPSSPSMVLHTKTHRLLSM